MLTITATATDDQYTTTSAVKDLLGTTLTSDDSLINSLISRASRWADQYVGYPLSAHKYREDVAGFGTNSLMLSRRPVVGVASIWSGTDTGTATTMLSSEYGVDHSAGIIFRDRGFDWDAPAVSRTFAVPLAPQYFSGQEDGGWLTDYIAGYTYAGFDTGSPMWTTAGETCSTSTGRRTLPEDIEEAVRFKAAEMYAGDANVLQRKVGDLQIMYAKSQTGKHRDPAEELLAPYRSVA